MIERVCSKHVFVQISTHVPTMDFRKGKNGNINLY